MPHSPYSPFQVPDVQGSTFLAEQLCIRGDGGGGQNWFIITKRDTGGDKMLFFGVTYLLNSSICAVTLEWFQHSQSQSYLEKAYHTGKKDLIQLKNPFKLS